MERILSRARAVVISLFLLLIISNARGRLLPSHQGDHLRTKPHENIQQDASLSSLMGLDLEECGDRDEMCEKRRMVAEAQLDYIYTQHQHP